MTVVTITTRDAGESTAQAEQELDYLQRQQWKRFGGKRFGGPVTRVTAQVLQIGEGEFFRIMHSTKL